MQLYEETTERNDRNNWVKEKLLNDNKFKIISFEGYTIKNNRVTALFDRRNFIDGNFDTLSDEEIERIIYNQDPFLESKLFFARLLDVDYYYIFYKYEDNLNKELLYSFRFDISRKLYTLKPRKTKFNDFCSFIEKTSSFRDLKMLSSYQESNIPKIDKIFRDRCSYPWMGNLDGLFLNDQNGNPKALIEFQTTIKTPVAEHCNNLWFAPKGSRKGDEQRWKVFHTLAKQSNLPLIIIVWSPKEVNGNIKYKIVSDVIYSNDPSGRKAGLVYSKKNIINYEELVRELDSI